MSANKHETGLVTVVVPNYNYGKHLPALLACLQEQRYTLWECVVVDDGSSDDSMEVLNALSQSERRLRFVQQENAGAAAARKRGIEEARGEYIQLLDADDLITEDKFETQLRLFAENHWASVVYSASCFANQDLSKQWQSQAHRGELHSPAFDDFVKSWENGLMIPIHAYLFRKTCFDQINFDPQFRTHEDWDLNLALSHAGFRYLYHPEVCAIYRIHYQSNARTDITGNRRDTLRVVYKFLGKKELSKRHKRLLFQRYCSFFNAFLMERLLHRNMRFLKVIRIGAPGHFVLIALLLFPFYLLDKILQKLLRNQ